MNLVELAVTAFLLGSIPFGYLLYRLATGGDIRARGSGNIGATNVLRSGGTRLGLLTLLLDAGKGWLALRLAAQWPGAGANGLALALVAVICGHLFTPWLRFRGGKGVATALGAFVALAPWPLLGAVALFLVVLGLTRYVSLASVAACVALPLLLLIELERHAVAPTVEMATALVAGLIIVRHRANLARLRAGTEAKLGARS